MTSDLEWRSLIGPDIPAVVALLAAAERVDMTREHYDERDLDEEFGDESLDPGRDTVAVLDGHRLVGMGVVRARGLVGGTYVIELWGTVHPDRRGEGIGRGILAIQLHRAAALHAELEPPADTRIVVRPFDHCIRHVKLVRAAGLHPLRHWFDMERDLKEPLPLVPGLGPDLAVVPYDPARDDEVRLAYNEAFADSFGAIDHGPETWAHWFTGSRAFRAERSSLVLHEGRVVGFSLCYFYEADAVVDGVTEGWIGQVGTLGGYRRRGIGTHLIARALQAHRDAGFDRAAIDVDGESDIGGLAIYARLGFRVSRKRTSFVRLLPQRGT